jgi:hypothetical protein
MNNLHHPCELWAEPISLAAAGCLSADEDQEVRRHLETCSECRERFRELTQLCGMLAEARLAAAGPEAAIVERVMSVVASGESGLGPLSLWERVRVRADRTKNILPSPPAPFPKGEGSFLDAQPEPIRPTFLTRSRTTWRWMMRSPISRVSAAAIFVLAITGIALWFHSVGATPAYADFLEPILHAKTGKYKLTTEMKGGTATTEVMMLGDTRSRSEMEMEMPNKSKSKMVQIWDGGQGKTLSLDPVEKRATVYNTANMPKAKKPNGGDVPWFRSLLLDAKDNPDFKRESLGEKDIHGRHVVGFRISNPTAVFCVWGNPKTGSPVRIEMTVAIMPEVKMTMSDFEFNVEMDESLFSVEPPAGYKVTEVQNPPQDESPSKEKDLIEMFRYYGQWSGGRFPDLLDMQWLTNAIWMEEWVAANLAQPPKPDAKRNQQLQEAQEKLQRGMMFTVLLPKEADWRYAGKGVSLGAADTPVFWYRPKDAKKYRVIDADLSVHEADTPPSVHDVNLEKDLIEMFRQYSELSDGRFPTELNLGKLVPVLMTKYYSPGQSQPQKRNAKEEQAIAEAQVKLLRGLTFLDLMPKEADSHYAGSRVSLGVADTPIFWYRPKDAKAYRVVYADLTVREAKTPPSVPYVLPEQDLIDMFHEYGKLVGGELPDSLDLRKMAEKHSMKIVKELFLDMCTPLNGKLDEKKRRKIEEGMQNLAVLQAYDPEKKPNKEEKAKREEQSHKIDEELGNLVDWDKIAPGKKNLSKKQKNLYKDAYTQKFMQSLMPATMGFTMRIQPGLTFADQLPPTAEAHYAGKGVSLGAADKPIFWYRPKDAKKYRVIYADLSVREADTPPNVPKAQPVPGPASPKK